jgi:phospholipid/cholesterol/gamma-HCH transport system substrate-binding protein
MPDRSKIRWSQLKVGVIALASFLILFVLVFLLTSSKGLFQTNFLLHTYMDDASGVAEGTPVRLNGITVGYLEKVVLTGSRNPNRTVEFDMQIQEKYLKAIPVDSVTAIGAANLLGDKFLNITKGTKAKTVQAGAELPSQQSQDIPELMAQSAHLLSTLQTSIGRLDSMMAYVEAGHGNLGLLLKDKELYGRLNGIAAEGQKLLSDVRGGGGTLSKLIYDDSLYHEMRAPLQRVDGMLAGLQKGEGTAGKLLKDPALYDEAEQTVKQMRTLLSGINAGQGTAGKLVKDDAVYQQLAELTAKFNSTLDRINAGQGTLGQLMVNQQLYESLNGVTHEAQGLVRDMHANPKKFLTIRLKLF